MPTMISTALPNVAFNKPESVSPSLTDSWSVHVPRSYSGSKEVQNKVSDESGGGTDCSQRHNGDEAEREPEASIPVQAVRDAAEGDEHEQYVQPRAEEEESE